MKLKIVGLFLVVGFSSGVFGAACKGKEADDKNIKSNANKIEIEKFNNYLNAVFMPRLFGKDLAVYEENPAKATADLIDLLMESYINVHKSVELKKSRLQRAIQFIKNRIPASQQFMNAVIERLQQEDKKLQAPQVSNS